MNRLRTVAGQKNVYYQGVDALIVNSAGYRSLLAAGEVSQLEIGKLRLEHTANYGAVSGICDYNLGDKGCAVWPVWIV